MRSHPGRPARRPGRRARRGWLTASALAALVLAASVVWQAGSAAFTWTSAPTTTTVGSGTVAISDDDAGTAAFTAGGLRPGASATRCFAVTSTGSAPAAVRLYATSRTTNALSGALRFSVLVGTGGGAAGCGGFRATATVYTGTLAAFPTAFGAGVGEWTTPGGLQTRTYQVTYSLPVDASTAAQNQTATVGLTWEARNT
ncbi:hypothetical protein [Blastococcus sp. TF02A-26]|uniref:hypothetical protein n=1 Tax=Blastococcus sp. TF02A-26 TaxID=2250577 RepID=UPI000DE873C3|nr:hypothetical protein [Blastococcus sp. TF02A-26]RBY88602.1 hypothetical protein DQ240_04135 [Blastococcus sp. TF02A-26]